MVGRLTENMATHDVGNGTNVKLGTIQIFDGTSKEIKRKQWVKQLIFSPKTQQSNNKSVRLLEQ